MTALWFAFLAGMLAELAILQFQRRRWGWVALDVVGVAMNLSIAYGSR